jgi:hypothetical protein
MLRDLLEEMDELFPPPPVEEETAFDLFRKIAFRELRFLEEALLEILAEDSLPLYRRILWAGGLLDRLEDAEEAHLEPRMFHQTLAIHKDRARDLAENSGIARPVLGLFERTLLRQLQGMCSSLAEKGLTSGSFFVRSAARLRRVSLAYRYVRGAGAIPAETGAASFAEVVAMRALHLPPESEALIARYLRTRIAARGYFGREAWGLAVIPGARAVLSLAALVLWHAKVGAVVAGRKEILHEDVRQGVLLVDHSIGHMTNLHSGPARRALQVILRRSWPQRALLHTIV